MWDDADLQAERIVFVFAPIGSATCSLCHSTTNRPGLAGRSHSREERGSLRCTEESHSLQLDLLAMAFPLELHAQQRFSSISTAGRSLEPHEVETLSRSGNWTTDWSHVRFAGSDAEASLSRIRGCNFIGPVLLHDFNSDVHALPDARTSPFPAGLYNSTLGWCFVAQNALLKDCSSVLNTVIGAETALVGCCSVSCAESTA
jgi:hypothetical protein